MAGHRKRTFSSAVESSLSFIFILWVIKITEIIFHLPLVGLGIVPREKWGLLGIIFAPLLHGDLAHLSANSGPLFVLLVLLYSNKRYFPEKTMAFIWILSGMGTWLIGRGDSVHIGASLLIFGLVSYLIVSGIYMRCWKAAFIAGLVLLVFGGIFYGVIPQQGRISWEGHLCGTLAGVWAARKNHLRPVLIRVKS